MNKISETIKENEEMFPFRIDDGILEIWERVLPEGDWSGRTATTEDLKEYFHDKQLRLLSAFKEMVEKTKLYKQDYSSGKFNLMTGTAKSKTILKTAKELKDDLLSSLTQELTEKE